MKRTRTLLRTWFSPLVAGLPVGALFGVLIPCIHDFGISSVAGGMIGLLVGPFVAVVQGIIIASIVNGIVRLATGKLRRRLSLLCRYSNYLLK